MANFGTSEISGHKRHCVVSGVWRVNTGVKVLVDLIFQAWSLYVY